MRQPMRQLMRQLMRQPMRQLMRQLHATTHASIAPASCHQLRSSIKSERDVGIADPLMAAATLTARRTIGRVRPLASWCAR